MDILKSLNKIAGQMNYGKTIKVLRDGSIIRESKDALDVRVKGKTFKTILKYFGPPAELGCEWSQNKEVYYYEYSLLRINLIIRRGDSIEAEIPIWHSPGRVHILPNESNAMLEMKKAVDILNKFTPENPAEWVLCSITYSPLRIEFDKNGLPSDDSFILFTYKRGKNKPRRHKTR